MAITTYSELKTALANWLDRDDLTSRIPEFIALAEARLSSKLRVREMETSSTVSATAGQNYIDLPSGFIGLINAYLNTDPKTELDVNTLSTINAKWAGSTSGKPRIAAIIGSKMYLGPTPDSAYSVVLTYYKFDALSDSNTTNWLLTRRPDLYLRAAQAEAEFYIGNDERAARLVGFCDAEIMGFESDEWDAAFGSPLQIRNETNP